MKRFISYILAAAMALGLCACGESGNSKGESKSADSSVAGVVTDTSEGTSITSDNSEESGYSVMPLVESVDFDDNLAVNATADGKSTIAVLCMDGTVKTMGNNDNGQLGVGDSGPHEGWQKIPKLSNIKQIWGVGESFFALDYDGKLYYWGDIGNRPRLIEFSEKVEQIFPSKFYLKTENNDIYEIRIWFGGTSRKSEISFIKTDYPHNSIPVWFGGYILDGKYSELDEELNANYYIKTDLTNARYYFLTKEGEVLYISDNNKVESLGGKGIKYKAGDQRNTSFNLFNDGDLTGWSYNESGQLGDGTYNKRLESVDIMSNVKNIKVRSQTVYALTNDNILYVWGKSYSATPTPIVYPSDFSS